MPDNFYGGLDFGTRDARISIINLLKKLVYSNLEPKLDPRQVSDSLYLHALYEGLAKIELRGWEELGKLPKKIINIPIVSCKKTTSFGTALLAINSK